MSAWAKATGIVFPNAIFKMIKPGKPLLKNQVAFIVPLNYGKIQIRSYLEQIYGVEVKRVATMVYQGKPIFVRDRKTGQVLRKSKRKDFKKAIVTMKEDFVYPDIERLKVLNPPTPLQKEEQKQRRQAWEKNIWLTATGVRNLVLRMKCDWETN